MHKVWIEAALNGAWSRALQPGIPIRSMRSYRKVSPARVPVPPIIHTHAYDGGGPQTFDWQVYARIIEGIRAQVDVPVYPSYPPIPATTAGANPSFADATVRFAHIEALAARGLLEFAVIDPGSVNFTLTATTSATKPADIYMNSRIPRPARARLRRAPRRSSGLCDLRAGFYARRHGAGAKRPVSKRRSIVFMFSEQFAFGFPPRAYALAAHLALLEEEAGPAPWMIAGLGVDIRPP